MKGDSGCPREIRDCDCDCDRNLEASGRNSHSHEAGHMDADILTFGKHGWGVVLACLSGSQLVS